MIFVLTIEFNLFWVVLMEIFRILLVNFIMGAHKGHLITQ
jgi:hypothetical protein